MTEELENNIVYEEDKDHLVNDDGSLIESFSTDSRELMSDELKTNIIKYSKEVGGEVHSHEIVKGVNRLPKDAVYVLDWGTTDLKDVVIEMSYEVLGVPDHAPPYVTSLKGMFASCADFDDPNVSKWDVSKITDMSSMFSGAIDFRQDIGNWDVSNVTDMSGMFGELRVFNADISRWNVSNVTDMSGMFIETGNFNADISKWDVRNVTNMSSMFYFADRFNADISRWNVSNVKDMSSMFYHAEAFNQDLSKWNVEHIAKEPHYFLEGADEWTLPKPQWGVSHEKDYDSLEQLTYKIIGTDEIVEVPYNQNTTSYYLPNKGSVEIEILSWGTFTGELYGGSLSFTFGANKVKRLPNDFVPHVTAKDFFTSNESLPYMDLSNINVDSIKNFEDLFFNAKPNDSIGSWDVSKITNFDSMFRNCLGNPNISGWDVSSATSMLNMFQGAINFNQDLSGWDVGKIEGKPNNFDKYANAWKLPKPNFKEVIEEEPLDYDQGYIKYKDHSGNTRYIKTYSTDYSYTEDHPTYFDDVAEILDWGVQPPGVDVDDLRIILQKIEVAPDNIPSWLTNLRKMFYMSIFELEGSDPWKGLENWDTSNVTNMELMFYGLSNFNPDISKWDVSNVTNMKSMFNSCDGFNRDLSGWNVEHIPEEPEGFADYTRDWVLPKPRWGKKPNVRLPVEEYDKLPQVTYLSRAKNEIQSFDLYMGSGFPFPKVDSEDGAEGIEIISWGSFSGGLGPIAKVPFTGVKVYKLPNRFTPVMSSSRILNSTLDMSDIDMSNLEIDSFNNITRGLFTGCNPNDTIGEWDVSSFTDFSGMFENCKSNPDISKWDTSKATNMDGMFKGASNFNRDLSGWNVSKIEGFPIDFDLDATSWELPRPPFKPVVEENPGDGYFKYRDTRGNIRYMSIGRSVILSGVAEILDWGNHSSTSNLSLNVEGSPNSRGDLVTLPDTIPSWVTGIGGLGPFNNNIPPEKMKDEILKMEGWDVSNVTDMRYLFRSTYYEGNYDYISDIKPEEMERYENILSNWNTSKVTTLLQAFEGNKDDHLLKNIGKWDVSNVTYMTGAFQNNLCNPDISSWEVSNCTNFNFMFQKASNFNQDLSGWDVEHIPTKPMGFDGFTTSWELPKPQWGVSVKEPNYDELNQITFKLVGSDEIFSVAYENGSADFPPGFDSPIEIISWGTTTEQSISLDFSNNTVIKFPDNFTSFIQPNRLFRYMDLSETDFSNINAVSIVSMKDVFEDANPNDTIKNWNVTHITNFSGCFSDCKSNPDISNWDTSNATNMDGMFKNATSFNRDLSGWDVGKIEGFPKDFDLGTSSWGLPRPPFKLEVGVLIFKDANFTTKTTKIEFDAQGVFTLPEEVVDVVNWGTIAEDVATSNVSLSIKCPSGLTRVPSQAPIYITSMDSMFEDCELFIGTELAMWDVSNVTSMKATFKNTKVLDVDLSNWDTSNVTTMEEMFMNSGIKG